MTTFAAARGPGQVAAAIRRLAAGLLLAVAGCGWIEVGEEPPTVALPQEAPAAVEPAPFRPARPPVPRPQPPAAAAALPVAATPGEEGRHRVRKGETLFSVARLHGVDAFSIASLNGLRPPYGLEDGQQLRIPPRLASAPPPEVPAASAETAAPTSPAVEAEPAPERPFERPAERPAEVASLPPPSAPAPSPPTAPVEGGFLWPVSGPVISKFGAKGPGLRNDGINIAAPAGTPIRAAQSGVVAYAGNELKGFGNIVLIRHDGGWVTAYAHAGEVLVSRGERVTRGQTIGRVGSTGNVTRPQLHFELRRERVAVDPLPYLGRASS